MLEIGTLLDGKYRILSEIGRGGMSVVYLALNERANKTWAVKAVRKDGGNDPAVVGRNLAAETEMLKRLSHPNLPSIVDVIDQDDSFIIVMDYIEGNSLLDLIETGGPQQPDQVIEWAKQLCDVLGYLHSRRPPVIYRDMKPANVMLRPAGDVALIDFGTAREYKDARDGDTTCLGTRGYAAPEQFGGRGQTDARTDIYALGATIYHLITGFSPADTGFVIRPLGAFQPRLRGSGIEKIVEKCCRPDPADRYQNCAELMYALDNVHKIDEWEQRRRRRKLAAFIACLSLSAIFALAGAGFHAAYANTKGRQYDKYVGQARTGDDFRSAVDHCRRAMNLDPGNPGAYQVLIEKVETLPEITKTEYDLVMDCIQSVDADPSNLKFNIDFLKDADRPAYAEFNYRFGTLIYLGYPSGKIPSREFLRNAIDSGGLDGEKLSKAQLMYGLADLWAKLRPAEPGKKKNDSIEIGGEYGEYWKKLNEISADLDSLRAQTGRIEYPIRMCDEIAGSLLRSIADFANANVGEADMRQTMDRAKSFMEGADSSLPELQEEIDRVKEDLAEAEETVTAFFKHHKAKGVK